MSAMVFLILSEGVLFHSIFCHCDCQLNFVLGLGIILIHVARRASFEFFAVVFLNQKIIVVPPCLVDTTMPVTNHAIVLLHILSENEKPSLFETFLFDSRVSQLAVTIFIMPKKNRGYIRDSNGDVTIRSPQSKSKINVRTDDNEEEDFNRKYDLTPLGSRKSKGKKASYSIDPWEVTSPSAKDGVGAIEEHEKDFFLASSTSDDSDSVKRYSDDRLSSEDHSEDDRDKGVTSRKTSFILPSDIHPRMEEKEDDIAQLRLLAGKLNADWGAVDFMAPALARRIRDFQFAQEKRRKKYGHEKPWGILGLYDHLTGIRVDIEWAEDGAWRRANGQP